MYGQLKSLKTYPTREEIDDRQISGAKLQLLLAKTALVDPWVFARTDPMPASTFTDVLDDMLVGFAAETVPVPLATLADENAKWPAMSMLQKAVRRSQPAWAWHAASALRNAGQTKMLWRRLAVIALEDVGLGGLLPLCLTLRVLETEEWINHDFRFEVAWGVIELLLHADKDRSMCDIGSVMEVKRPRLQLLRGSLPTTGPELKQVAVDPEQPIMARVMAHRKLAVTQRLQEDRWDLYSTLKLPAVVLYAVANYVRFHKDDMWAALPIIWDLAASSNELAVDKSAGQLDAPLIGGVPSVALDMFTYHGKRAMARLVGRVPQLHHFVTSHPAMTEDALGFALFAVEGGELSSSFRYDRREEIQIETLTDEFESVGLSLAEAAELCDMMYEHLPTLQECRAQTVQKPFLIGG